MNHLSELIQLCRHPAIQSRRGEWRNGDAYYCPRSKKVGYAHDYFAEEEGRVYEPCCPRESPMSNYGFTITAEEDGYFILADPDEKPKDFSMYADQGLLLGLWRKHGESWDWEEYTPELKDGKYIQIDMKKGDKISLDTMSLIATYGRKI